MISIHPIATLGEIASGDDLGVLLAQALADAALQTDDVLVVTQKIVSKAEGQMVSLAAVQPSARAISMAESLGKDARLVELVLQESTDVVRASRGVLITRHRLGLVMANAGIDCSNLGPDGADKALLLPVDPDGSARGIADAIEQRLGMRPGVIIADSFGRPWRHGVVNVAVGSDGIAALDDRRGGVDRDGRVLQATLIATADLIASAAGLVMGEASESVPAVLLRGLVVSKNPLAASALIRAVDEDLFA